MSITEKAIFLGEGPPFRKKKYEKSKVSTQSAFDLAFFVCLLVFICIAPFIRFYGGALFLVFLAVQMAYVIIKRGFVFYPSLALFTAIGLLYMILSYAEALPNAWTRFYVASYIPQQASFVIALYPTILAARLQWHYIFSHKSPGPFLILLGIFGVISGLLAIFILNGDSYYFMMARNSTAFIYVMLLWFVINGSDIKRYIGAGLILAMAILFGTSGQVVVNSFVIAIIICAPWPRLVALGAIAGIVIVYIATLIYFDDLIFDIWRLDHNTGIRIIFLRDAFEALSQTYGIGVGFGKEALVNNYSAFNHTHIDWQRNFGSYMTTSLHNSFAAISFRLGVLGAVLFIWFLFTRAFPRKLEDIKIVRLMSCVFFITFVTLFVNVGLESPTFIIGIGWMIGLCLFLGKAGKK